MMITKAASGKSGTDSESILENPSGYTDENNMKENVSTHSLKYGETVVIQSDHACEEYENTIPPDGGCWAWVVCFSSFLANGAVYGVLNTYGILLPKIIKEMNDGRDNITSQVALIGYLAVGLTSALSSLTGICLDAFGFRRTACVGAVLGFVGLLSSAFASSIDILFVTFSLLVGIGGALLYTPALTILCHYFARRLSFVNGITMCGSVSVSVVQSVSLPYMLDDIGLSYTFICLSTPYFFVIFLTYFWRRLNAAPNVSSPETNYAVSIRSCKWKQFFNRYIKMDILKNRRYCMWVLSLAIGLGGYFIPYAHLVSHTNQVMPGKNGAALITCMQVTSGLSSLNVGRFCDRTSAATRLRIHQMSLAFMGLCSTCIPWATQYWHLVIIALVCGVFDGAFNCLYGPIAFDIVGKRNFSQSLGFSFTIISIPCMLGPVIAGYIKDHLGDYAIAFHVSGIPSLVGAFTMSFISTTKLRRNLSGVEIATIITPTPALLQCSVTVLDSSGCSELNENDQLTPDSSSANIDEIKVESDGQDR